MLTTYFTLRYIALDIFDIQWNRIKYIIITIIITIVCADRPTEVKVSIFIRSMGPISEADMVSEDNW